MKWIRVAVGVAMVFQLVAGAAERRGVDYRDHGVIQNQFAECQRLLGQARVSGAGVPGAQAYLNQADRILRQAQLDYNRWYQIYGAPNPSSSSAWPSDPFGDFLFKGVPFRPADGKLVVRHFDPDQFTSRATQWMGQMRQMTEKIEAMRTGKEQALAADVERMLRQLGGMQPYTPDAAKDLPTTLGGRVQEQIQHLAPSATAEDSSGVVGLLRNPYDTDIYAPAHPAGIPASQHDFSWVKSREVPFIWPAEESLTLMEKLDKGSEEGGALWAKVGETRKAEISLRTFDAEEVGRVLKEEQGWVIAARPLADWKARNAIAGVAGREDNPYGMHWQIFLPGAVDIGLFAGDVQDDSGKSLLNIGADPTGRNYTGVVASGKNGALMKQAALAVKDRWNTQYYERPSEQGYSAGMRNCQDYVGEVLREYHRLLAAENAKKRD